MQIQVLSIFDINREDAIDGVKKILDGPNVKIETIEMVIKESVRLAVEKLLKANFGNSNVSITTDPPLLTDSHVYRIKRLDRSPGDVCEKFKCTLRSKLNESREWLEDSLDAAVGAMISEALKTNGEVITRSNISVDLGYTN